jgi:hypothetical protein
MISSQVSFEFHIHFSASFFRSELARHGKHLAALGTPPCDGCAVNSVNNNQFWHNSSLSQSHSSKLSNRAQLCSAPDAILLMVPDGNAFGYVSQSHNRR